MNWPRCSLISIKTANWISWWFSLLVLVLFPCNECVVEPLAIGMAFNFNCSITWSFSLGNVVSHSQTHEMMSFRLTGDAHPKVNIFLVNGTNHTQTKFRLTANSYLFFNIKTRTILRKRAQTHAHIVAERSDMTWRSILIKKVNKNKFASFVAVVFVLVPRTNFTS